MFSIEKIKNLLPDYLRTADKDRLSKALAQFQTDRGNIDYTDFYIWDTPDFWLQGDLLFSIRQPQDYSHLTKAYGKDYGPAIIISNTCDLEASNKRFTEKECLMAVVYTVEDWVERMGNLNPSAAKLHIENLKKQLLSNFLYLPPLPEDSGYKQGYVVRLDSIFKFPVSELNSENYIKARNEIRVATLSNFGFYLFIIKLSYHFCRLPEDPHRPE